MSIPFDELLSDFTSAEPASEEAITAAEREIGKSFPADYRKFLLEVGGGEGFIGKHYLILWSPEELAQFNREYQAEEYVPGLVLIGSNGGGEAFAFDTRSVPYKLVQVPFIGMSLKEAAVVSINFDNLMERMLRVDGSLL